MNDMRWKEYRRKRWISMKGKKDWEANGKDNCEDSVKGAQAWEFFHRVFCTKRTHLDMWRKDCEKNRIFFFNWPLISMVFGFLPHAECAVNKKNFEARPK